jgi:hypothetical protein
MSGAAGSNAGSAGYGPKTIALGRELSENLGALQQRLQQLLTIAENKLQAMRHADDAALHGCAAQEQQQLEAVLALERQRKAILARLAQQLQTGSLLGVPLSEITEKIPEPAASALRARNAALQAVAAKLRHKNEVAARVAHQLQSHIRAVFAELAKANQESVVYGPQGQHSATNTRRCLDAVG